MYARMAELKLHFKLIDKMAENDREYPPEVLIVNCLAPNFVQRRKNCFKKNTDCLFSLWLIYPLNTTWIGALMHPGNSTEQFETDLEKAEL